MTKNRSGGSPRALLLAAAALLTACPGPQPPPSGEATTAPPPPAASPAVPATAAAAPPPAGSSPPDPPGAATTWSFDAAQAGAAPPGFSFGRTGGGAAGRWEVRAEPDAPSKPHVLAQIDADPTSFRFPVAVAEAPLLKDLRLSVRCKPVSGKVDQACGLVFRYRDADNYYVTRANALEDNVRLYTVKGGRRKELASFNGAIEAGAWHDYRVEARGEHFQIFWNGAKVLDHRDATFSEPGQVGVWTKADSVTYFDDLRVEPVDS